VAIRTSSFPLMEGLFKEMDKGASLSMTLRQKLLRFNGGLFAEQTVLPGRWHAARPAHRGGEM